MRAASCPTAWYVKERSPRPATSVVDSALSQSAAGRVRSKHAGVWHHSLVDDLRWELAGTRGAAAAMMPGAHHLETSAFH